MPRSRFRHQPKPSRLFTQEQPLSHNVTELTKKYPVSSRFIIACVLPMNDQINNDLGNTEKELAAELKKIKKASKKKARNKLTQAQKNTLLAKIKQQCIDLFVKQFAALPYPDKIKIGYGELFFQHLQSQYVKPIKGLSDPTPYRGGGAAKPDAHQPASADAKRISEIGTIRFKRFIKTLNCINETVASQRFTKALGQQASDLARAELQALIKLNYQLNTEPTAKLSDMQNSVYQFICSQVDNFNVTNLQELASLNPRFHQAMHLAGIPQEADRTRHQVQLFTLNEIIAEQPTDTKRLSCVVMQYDRDHPGYHTITQLLSEYAYPGTQRYVDALKDDSIFLQTQVLQTLNAIAGAPLTLEKVLETTYFIKRYLHALGLYQLAIQKKNAFLITQTEHRDIIQRVDAFEGHALFRLNDQSYVTQGLLKTLVIIVYSHLRDWQIPILTPVDATGCINPEAILTNPPKRWGRNINHELKRICESFAAQPNLSANILTERDYLYVSAIQQGLIIGKSAKQRELDVFQAALLDALIKYLAMTQYNINHCTPLSPAQLGRINRLENNFTRQIDKIEQSSNWLHDMIDLFKKLTKSGEHHIESDPAAEAVIAIAEALPVAEVVETVAATEQKTVKAKAVKQVKLVKIPYEQLLESALKAHYGTQLEKHESGYTLKLAHPYQLSLQSKGQGRGFLLSAEGIELARMPARTHREANPAYAARLVKLIDASATELEQVIASKAQLATEPSATAHASMERLQGLLSHIALCQQIGHLDAELSAAELALKDEKDNLFLHLYQQLKQIQSAFQVNWKPDTTILMQLESFQDLLMRSNRHLSATQAKDMQAAYQQCEQLILQQAETFLTTRKDDKTAADNPMLYKHLHRKINHLLHFIRHDTTSRLVKQGLLQLIIKQYRTYCAQATDLAELAKQLNQLLQQLPTDSCLTRGRISLERLLEQTQSKLQPTPAEPVNETAPKPKPAPALLLTQPKAASPQPKKPAKPPRSAPAKTKTKQPRQLPDHACWGGPAAAAANTKPAQATPSETALEYTLIPHNSSVTIDTAKLDDKILSRSQDQGISSLYKLTWLVHYLQQSGIPTYLSGYAALDLTGCIASSWKHSDMDAIVLTDHTTKHRVDAAFIQLEQDKQLSFSCSNQYQAPDASFFSESWQDYGPGMQLDITIITTAKTAWTPADYLQKPDHRSSYAALALAHCTPTASGLPLLTIRETHRLTPVGSQVNDKQLVLGKAYMQETRYRFGFVIGALVHLIKCAVKSNQVEAITPLLTELAACIPPIQTSSAQERLSSRIPPVYWQVLQEKQVAIPLLQDLFSPVAAPAEAMVGAIPH